MTDRFDELYYDVVSGGKGCVFVVRVAGKLTVQGE